MVLPDIVESDPPEEDLPCETISRHLLDWTCIRNRSPLPMLLQISGSHHDFSERPDATMRIFHEAIYQALYVQGRGALRRELSACLRTGRALRVPRARTR